MGAQKYEKRKKKSETYQDGSGAQLFRNGGKGGRQGEGGF